MIVIKVLTLATLVVDELMLLSWLIFRVSSLWRHFRRLLEPLSQRVEALRGCKLRMLRVERLLRNWQSGVRAQRLQRLIDSRPLKGL